MIRSVAYLVLFGLLVVLVGLDLLYHYGQLPDRMAMHFNVHGQPNGWGGKSSYAALVAVLLMCISVLYPALWLCFPWLPVTWMGIPNREYWISPERVEQTRELFRNSLIRCGCYKIALIGAVFHLIMRGNLELPPTLGREVWWWVGGFGLALAVDFGRMLWTFRRPEAGS